MSRARLEADVMALHPASFGWALACCGGDREEAQDVLQIAYVKVLEERARFDGGSSFRTWLFAVIRRTAAERRRTRWLRERSFGRWWTGTPAAAVADPEEAAGQAEEHARLRAMLRKLPRRQREVLHLVFYQELTLEDAARVAGISVGSARTHYHRGKGRLRAMMSAS
jgi:RNA polymerase sigma-70 factor (ECF subfamily)